MPRLPESDMNVTDRDFRDRLAEQLTEAATILHIASVQQKINAERFDHYAAMLRKLRHVTSVRVMGDARHWIYMAECSCGWESSGLRSFRREASDDARTHRNDERNDV